jgi:uncharacterized protein
VINENNEFYLPVGLAIPVVDSDGLSAPYWNGLRKNELLIQHCEACDTFQFGPEYLCHHCHTFAPTWSKVNPRGLIYSWERIWHSVEPCLDDHTPYIVVLVELLQASGIRMLGNLLGDPNQEVLIGAEVEGVFEHHSQAVPPFALLQWRYVEPLA